MNLCFAQKVPIDKGWSDDKKYCATDGQGNKYLLRISPKHQYDRKKSEFDMMNKVAALGVSMCKPLEFGLCDEGVYSIQSWICGTDAEGAIPQTAFSGQYDYGFEAGRILKEIHTIAAPDGAEDWKSYYNGKIDRNIAMYEECPIKYENGETFINYINAHRHLLEERPSTYQHGDYHIGNMMIGNDDKLYIIDFNRNGFGDPWEDMKSIVWDAEISPYFASGRINGYFENDVPMKFWELLALYISVGAISSIPWALPYGDEQIEIFTNQAKSALSWYDNMKSVVPEWYIR